jgi:hypothetical protein
MGTAAHNLTRITSALCLLTSALLTTACGTSRPVTTAPELTSVPSAAIEALCTKLRGEGVATDAPLVVVEKTQPLIITGASLRSLAHTYGKDVESSALAQAITSVVKPTPLDFQGTSCAWQTIPRLDPVAQAQMTVVQFSAPFVNPFTKGESGVLVRMSVGNHDAQWYWIPLALREGRLGVGLVMAMDMHEG